MFLYYSKLILFSREGPITYTLFGTEIKLLKQLLCSLAFRKNETRICAEIVEQYMGARNRVGIGLSYRPAMQATYRLTGMGRNAYSVPTWFLGPIDCSKITAPF